MCSFKICLGSLGANAMWPYTIMKNGSEGNNIRSVCVLPYKNCEAQHDQDVASSELVVLRRRTYAYLDAAVVTCLNSSEDYRCQKVNDKRPLRRRGLFFCCHVHSFIAQNKYITMHVLVFVSPRGAVLSPKQMLCVFCS